MRKVALISVFVYLVLNLGISLKLNYCGDRISFIDFFPIEEKSCCEDTNASCCSNKTAFIYPGIDQINPTHSLVLEQNLVFDFIPALSELLVVASTFPTGTLSSDIRIPDKPDIFSKTPLYLFKNTLRI